MSEESGIDTENPYALTTLEQQVVELLMGGLTVEEVGDLLGIDKRVVALRRASAMRKYGARNPLHLAHLVEITKRKLPEDEAVAPARDTQVSLSF
jgi:DNA-binding NarL/FixJ family response regulator